MLIALLAVLGVDLIVIGVVLGSVLSRRRWVKRQPEVFPGAIRVVDGELDGLRPKWKRGYGRWVRGVFVWTRGPFLFRNELMAVDGVEDTRVARPGEIRRLGDHPIVVRLAAGNASVEVAAASGEGRLVPTRSDQSAGAHELR